MKLKPRGFIPEIGDRQVSEKTDSDYWDKRIADFARTIKSLSPEWAECFVSGLDARDRRELKDRGVIP